MLEWTLKGNLMEKEIRHIESFTKISFKDYGTLVLTQGEQESLTVEADEKVLPELITEVRSGKLVLGFDEDWLKRLGKIISSVFDREQHQITYYLTCVNLESISVSGNCKLECESLETPTLGLHVSGYGDLSFGYLSCDSLNVHISGRGEFKGSGRADEQKVFISGSGEYKAADLTSQKTKVAISGQGNADLHVEEDLNITISGLGQVNYHGRPKLRQVISGLGKSRRLDDKA
jgi:hypothetical protein